FFQAEDGIRDGHVTGVQTCALPIFERLRDDAEGAAVELAGEEDLLHQVGQPLRLDRDHVEQLVLGLRAQVVLALEQRHGGAVRRSEERRVGKEWTSRVLTYEVSEKM